MMTGPSDSESPMTTSTSIVAEVSSEPSAAAPTKPGPNSTAARMTARNTVTASCNQGTVHFPTLKAVAIEVITGDITTLEVDVVVNAANEYLSHGGGVAAAIARAGAPTVDRESDAWIAEHGQLSPGEAAHTGAGAMPARWVVHVAGPRYQEGQDNEGPLRQAVRAALDRSRELGARSVALPAISAGIFGYPRPEATAVIASEVQTWLKGNPNGLERVVLMGYDDGTSADFRRGLEAAGAS